MPTPSPSLPPSARDFLAYERIVIESASTRQVAAELKISQTRVRQIVVRVADWLPSNLPQHSEATDATQLRLAQYIAADRLQHYLVEVSRAWQQTHESKYMTAILRILTAQSKLPAHPGTLEALAADVIAADATEGPLPSGAGLWPAAPPPLSSSPPPPLSPSPSVPTPDSPLPTPSLSPPPSEACSPSPTVTHRTVTKNTTAPSPTPESATTSAPSANTNHPARRAFLTPAHPPESDDVSMITELKITPQKLGLQTSQPSSRRDRRRLKRLLAK